MTQEEKSILLKDLCARLPYGVFVHTWYNKPLDIKYTGIDLYTNTINLDISDDDNAKVYINNCKPYLRPMSSMTEEEKNELRNILWFGYPSDDNDRYSHRGIEVKQCLYDDEKHSTYDFDDFGVFENFLLKNHLDYRGLIPMGLALEAPKDMYKI